MNACVIGFAAWSGTGKTTLLEAVVARLRARGLRLAVIKHAHHDFDIDHPGKDSHRLRQAGAQQVMVASRRRWALITEHDDDRPEPRLAELLPQLDASGLDFVLVEGFKHEPIPKIELHRPALGKPRLYPDDPQVIAIAADGPLAAAPNLPVLDLNDADAVCDFLIDYRARHGARANGSKDRT
ncbi:MAG: molybdopterin-guanine dinucleotide biosynthesis protein B [Thiohalomonadaceae bacterium]